jgi:hypothetical protein
MLMPVVTESAACARSANGVALSCVRGNSASPFTRMPTKRGDVLATAPLRGDTEPSATANTPLLTGTPVCASVQRAVPPLAVL